MTLKPGWPKKFYRIITRGDGLADIWLTPGDPAPFVETNGRVDFRFRILAVRGIDPEDLQWGGDLEGHIRAHYQAWVESAEEIEI